MEEPVILVTGATGNTGSKLVRLLAEAGAPARALVRSPEKAASIHRLGMETVLGDFEQPDTLDAAMAGCDHLFLLSPPSPHQAEQERNAIDAAKRAGVGHVVALSVLGSSPDASVPFGRWHGEIDRASGRVGPAAHPATAERFHAEFSGVGADRRRGGRPVRHDRQQPDRLHRPPRRRRGGRPGC
jgi:uncharacterized protein YbjT (DUF2867 family)